MQFTNYFLVSLVCFLGLFTGFFLVKIAPEEQKPLKKYLVVFQYIILALVLALNIFFLRKIVPIIAIAILVSLFFLMAKRQHDYRKVSINSAILGAVFFVASLDTKVLAMTSALIFLFFLAESAICRNVKEGNFMKIIAGNFLFVVASNFAYLTISRF